MNGFLRHLLSYRHETDLLGIASGFHKITVEQKATIERQKDEILQLKLEYARWGRGVVENFLVALDRIVDSHEDTKTRSEKGFHAKSAKIFKRAVATPRFSTNASILEIFAFFA